MHIFNKKDNDTSIHIQSVDVAIPEVIVERTQEIIDNSNREDDTKDSASEIDYSCAIPEIHLKK